MMTEQEILALYEKENAVWFFDYSGDPKAPHVELTSGFCSDGYVNSALVLAIPEVVALLASELVSRLKDYHIERVDWVVGSAYGAITFSYEVARKLGVRHGFVEKDPAGDPKKMFWDRFVIPAGAQVLRVEELITTMATVTGVRRAIGLGNPELVRFLPEVATIIYRPAKLQGDGPIDVIALVRCEVKSWKAEECPLCAAGSPRLRPKYNWARLTGKVA